jgi:hypothetical protein
MTVSYIIRSQMGAKRYIPRIRVSFHTSQKCYQVIATEGLDNAPDPTYQLLSVTTNKTLQDPAGSFTVQLAGDEWMYRLTPNDLVVISMGYAGETLDTVMVGFIDSVTRSRTVSEGSASVTTTVTGRDMGKMLIKAMLRFYPEIQQADIEKYGLEPSKFFLTEVGWVTLLDYFTGKQVITGSPANVLDIMVRRILQKLYQVQWSVYDEAGKEPVKRTVGLGNIMRYTFAETSFFTLPTLMSLTSFDGSVWNLMERACHKPFLELFVDTRNPIEAWNDQGQPMVVNETIEELSNEAKAHLEEDAYPSPAVQFGEDKAKVLLALRNTPFDKDKWEKLYTHDLQAVDVISENIGFNDNEHYNLFWAGTTVNPLIDDLKRVSPPEINGTNIERYGLSPLEVQIEGLQYDTKDFDTGVRKILLLTQNLNKKLKEWYQNNHTFWNGTMEVRGKGSYKIGQKLRREGIGREFYIEGVSQTFTLYNGWTTTLTLTRGQLLQDATDKSINNKPVVEAATTKPTSEKTPDEIKGQFHTVQMGDTLWGIAKQYYGDGALWNKIWEANSDILIQRDSRNQTDKGHYLYEGQVLRIP